MRYPEQHAGQMTMKSHTRESHCEQSLSEAIINTLSLPSSEQERLQALRNLRILHTPAERDFDDITSLAARLLDAPIALISLVEENYQWFKSEVGLGCEWTSREVSFCAHMIKNASEEVAFVVPDATQDEVFKTNSLVTGAPYIRMYAGMPLITREGHIIGGLCVIDTKPRTPTNAQLESLAVLARAVVSHIELRHAVRSLRESEEKNSLVIQAALDAIIILDANRRITAWSPEAEELFGYREEEARGELIEELIFPGRLASRGAMEELFTVKERLERQKDVQELLLRQQGGYLFHGEMSIASLSASAGATYACYVRDISARKEREKRERDAETRDVVIFAMAKLAESRDPDTGAHIERVQSYCQALAEQLAAMRQHESLVDPEFIRLIYTSSALHDIGKVGVPDDILLKPGRLNDREFEVMKTHTLLGADTLEAALQRFPKTRFLEMARNIAATHHERFDGTGYPRGLKGSDIPLCGRVVALADVYDALTSRRVYKKAYSHEMAKAMIVRESGKHFDPAVVDAFIAIESTFEDIGRRFADLRADAA